MKPDTGHQAAGSNEAAQSTTPAPWVRRIGVGQYAEEVVAKSPRGKDIVVARVGGGMDKREANARLIAAAPDLLAELENIANANTADWDDPSDFKAWAQSRARAAIAKAQSDSSEASGGMRKES